MEKKYRNSKSMLKRVLALTLSVLMLFGSISLGDVNALRAYADNIESDGMSESLTDEDGPVEDFSGDEESIGQEEFEDEVLADFNQSITIDGIEILAYAPEGVFPAGAYLTAQKITTRRVINKIEETLASEIEDEEVEIESTVSFDIKVFSKDGEEIEPDTEYGTVEVTFKNVSVPVEEEKDLSIYHVSDDLESATAIDTDVNARKDSATIEAEHFSIYTVVITSGVSKGKNFKYFQGVNKARSYFTIYNAEDLKLYIDLINKKSDGSLKTTDNISAILVNKDDENPLEGEGITNLGQSKNMTVKDLNFSVRLMDDINIDEINGYTPIKVFPKEAIFDGNGYRITSDDVPVVVNAQNAGVLICENQGKLVNIALTGEFKISVNASASKAGGIVGLNSSTGTIINSLFNNKLSFNNLSTSATIGAIAGVNQGSIINAYTGNFTAYPAIGNGTGTNVYTSSNDRYPISDITAELNAWVRTNGKTALGDQTSFTPMFWINDSQPFDKLDPNPQEEIDENDGKYARVIVRLDGKKVEIGQAITGAEAIAISSDDGKTYIRLDRTDDLGTYETPLSNLNEGENYKIYYVYENINDSLSNENEYITTQNSTYELSYISVKYDLYGANTYTNAGGKYNQDVKAAVRARMKEDGTYEAMEDYDVALIASDGFNLPDTNDKNDKGQYKVRAKVGDTYLVRGQGFTYTLDKSNLTSQKGFIHVDKEKITKPLFIESEGGVELPKPRDVIVLHTKGGTIKNNPLWEQNAADGTYFMHAYETSELPTDAEMTPIFGSTSIAFAGWYTDINTSAGKAVTKTGGKYIHTYNPAQTVERTVHYYAKWVIKNRKETQGRLYYEYNSNGRMEIRGAPPTDPNASDTDTRVSYGKNGFQAGYHLGALNGITSDQTIGFPSVEGSDIFVRLGSSNIWVGEVYTFEGGLVKLTYIFENRGTQNQGEMHFGLAGDVYIAGDDYATIHIDSTDPKYPTTDSRGAKFLLMKAKNGKDFKLYLTPDPNNEISIDKVDTCWFGYYSSTYNNIFTSNGRYSDSSTDSGIAFSWKISGVPAGGITTKSTKLGLDESSNKAINVTLNAGLGEFTQYKPDGKPAPTTVVCPSPIGKIEVVGETVRAYQTANTYDTYTKPERKGYKFEHWSTGKEGGPDATGKEFKDDTTLFATWSPLPDKSVTNNSKIQKVSGSDELLVPVELGSIVIENETPNATDKEIPQGATVQKAAGTAGGFNGTLVIKGDDDRYLLPDDVEVYVSANGKRTKLTRNTGYSYEIWNNRKKAAISIRKQYIEGDIEIIAIGYELPPVRAEDKAILVTNASIQYGDTAEFVAQAQTSKNHIATYQWYVAKYHDNELDHINYWDYQNQDGERLLNGTYTGSLLKQDLTEAQKQSIKEIKIEGADKQTLRITGLPVNEFKSAIAGESGPSGLHKGGYHVYCEVTSTRNITGQQIKSISSTAEVQVRKTQYDAPTEIYGSSTTYEGAMDGEIIIGQMVDRPALQWRRALTGAANAEVNWVDVNATQKNQGKISNLTAGNYNLRYKHDENHTSSVPITVSIADGKKIKLTFRAQGCDDLNQMIQTKEIVYNTTVGTDITNTLVTPSKKGFEFVGWSVPSGQITRDITIDAIYDPKVYSIRLLDENDEPASGTNTIYEKYSVGFFSNDACTNKISASNGIEVPSKEGYTFVGYYTNKETGSQYINSDGKLNENILNTWAEDNSRVLYARWSKNAEGIDLAGKDTFTISFMDSDGSRVGKSFSGAYTSKAYTTWAKGVAMPLPIAEKTGYTFGGWYTNVRGTGSSITEIPASNTLDAVTVYAKWIGNKYNILLNLDGGSYVSGYTQPRQYQHGSETQVALPTADEVTKSNYYFHGWYTTPEHTGAPVQTVDSSLIGTVSYYAYWVRNTSYEINTHSGSGYGVAYTIVSEDNYYTSVYEGADYKFKVKMNSGYDFSRTDKSVDANGRPIVPDANGVYTISNIRSDMDISVDYVDNAHVDEYENTVATILFADGTTGHFPTLEEAVSYVTTHKKNSSNEEDQFVIRMTKPYDIPSPGTLEIPAGYPVNIDLNGKTITGDKILVKQGGTFTIGDSNPESQGGNNHLNLNQIENRGTLTVGNGAKAADILNYGIATNNGTVEKLTQGARESGGKSRFTNNGDITGQADITSGYYVENTSNPPAGLTGFHTIMNDNEYYNSFQDALDIAKKSNKENNTIKVLDDIDNNTKTLNIENDNGKNITLDLNGHNITGGTINTKGNISITNTDLTTSTEGKGIITSAINNTKKPDSAPGSLNIESGVRIEGTVNNQGNINNEGVLAGAVTNNNGSITNENTGKIPGTVTNKGTLENKGQVSNVVLDSGQFINNGGTISDGAQVQIKSGSYIPLNGATPQQPDTVAVKVVDGNGVPHYYPNLKEAVEDINTGKIPANTGSQSEIKVILTKPVTLTDENQLTINPPSGTSVNLDLNGKDITGTTPAIVISGDVSISDGMGGTSTPSDGISIPVIVDSGADANLEGVKLNNGVSVSDGGSLDIDTNSTVSGGLTNNGDVTNKGRIEGAVTNESNGTINSTGTGAISGTVTNNGGEIVSDVALQSGGADGGQTGAKITRTKSDGSEEVKYYPSLQEALNYSKEGDTVTLISDETTGSEIVVTKSGVTIDLGGNSIGNDGATTPKLVIGTNVTGITLKDSGKPGDPQTKGTINSQIDNNGNITINEGTSVKEIHNNGSVYNNGNINGRVVNNSTLTNKGNITGDVIINSKTGVFENDGSITGNVDNKGTFKNSENGTITGDISNTEHGSIVNNGEIEGGISSFGGSVINGETGTVTGSLDISGGDFKNDNTQLELDEDRTGAVAIIERADGPGGATQTHYYSSLADALKDAKEGETVKLIKDISPKKADNPQLPAEDTTITKNNITIDLNGYKIGTSSDDGAHPGIIVSSGVNGVKIADLSTSSSGEIYGPVTNNGTITLDETIGVKGTVTNNSGGSLTNKANITGNIENNGGNFVNEGTVTGNVTVNSGTFNNSGGTVGDGNGSNVTVNGGNYVPNTSDSQNPETLPDTSYQNAVASIEKNGVVTYYPSLQDAIDNSNPGEVITIQKSITEGDDISITKPGVQINLNGKIIGGDSNSPKINISAEGGLTINNGQGTNGEIKSIINNSGSLTNNPGVKLNGELINDGELENKGIINGKLTNNSNGGTVNNVSGGEINGNVVNSGGFTNSGTINSNSMFENKPNASLTNTTGGNIHGKIKNEAGAGINNSGQIDGEGGIVNNGQFTNTGSIKTGVVNVGGVFDNSSGTIDTTAGGSVTVQGGEFNGNGNEELNVSNETKVSVTKDGKVTYYENLTDAINSLTGGEKITLLQDISSQDGGTTAPDIDINVPGVSIDLNGKNLGEQGQGHPRIIVSKNGGLTIKDSSGSVDVSNPGSGNGHVNAPVVNNGNVNIDNTVTINDDVTNSGTVINNGRLTDNAFVTNNTGATITNNGTVAGPIGNVGVITNAPTGKITGTLTNNESATINNQGSISGTITNNAGGSINNNQGGSVSGSITNKGDFTNNGEIGAAGVGGSLTNEGSFVNGNGGSIKVPVTNTNGSFDNNKGGVIDTEHGGSISIQGGEYDGELDPEDVPASMVAKIGGKYFTDLDKAIEATNKESGSVKIELLKDANLPSDGGVALINPDTTIELNGHDITEGKIKVGSGGKLKLSDSTENKGIVSAAIDISSGASVVIGSELDVNGNVSNSGTLTNDGYISGAVDNKGSLTNNNVLSGKVTNLGSGTLTNSGNIENDVINKDNATLTNKEGAKINGELENSGNAKADNNGYIHQLEQEGGVVNNGSKAKINDLLLVSGTVNNQGEVGKARITDDGQFLGEEPEGLEGVSAILTYVDENGKVQREPHSTLEGAVTSAQNKNGKDVTLTLKADLPQNREVVIDDSVSLTIDLNGHSMGDGGKEIKVNGGKLTILDGGDDKGGGVLNHITQTGGDMKLENGEFNGVTIAPATETGGMKTDLSGDGTSKPTFHHPPGTNTPALEVKPTPGKEDAISILSAALGGDTVRDKADTSGNRNPASFSVNSDGSINIGTGAGEVISTAPINPSDLGSGLEVAQKINENNENGVKLEPATDTTKPPVVKLTGDVGLSDTLGITGDVSIDLGGNTLKGPDGESEGIASGNVDGKPAINVLGGADIEISNGTVKGGDGKRDSQTGSSGKGGSGIVVEDGGSLNIGNTSDKTVISGGNGASHISDPGSGGDGITNNGGSINAISGDGTNKTEISGGSSGSSFFGGTGAGTPKPGSAIGGSAPFANVTGQVKQEDGIEGTAVVKDGANGPNLVVTAPGKNVDDKPVVSDGITKDSKDVSLTINPKVEVSGDKSVDKLDIKVDASGLTDSIIAADEDATEEGHKIMVTSGGAFGFNTIIKSIELSVEVEQKNHDVAEVEDTVKKMKEQYGISKNPQVAAFLDIVINRITKDESGNRISTINIKELDLITISFVVPKEYRGHKDYRVVRKHDGKYEIIIPTTAPNEANGWTITFKSNKFSEFGLLYTPVGTQKPDPQPQPDPQPGPQPQGGTGNSSKPQEPEKKPEAVGSFVYRLFNKVTGEHLYTASTKERDILNAMPEWSYEKIEMSGASAEDGGKAIRRLYNKFSGEHLYLRDGGLEMRTLLSMNVGWVAEQIVFYEPITEGKPVYRLFNPKNPVISAHHWTTDAKERDILVKSHGWIYEQVSFMSL